MRDHRRVVEIIDDTDDSRKNVVVHDLRYAAMRQLFDALMSEAENEHGDTGWLPGAEAMCVATELLLAVKRMTGMSCADCSCYNASEDKDKDE
jgi:hypothetical protein